MWLWLVALIRSIFGRAAAAPAPALPPLRRRHRIRARAGAPRDRRTDERNRTTEAVLTLERELPPAEARLAKVAAERDQRRDTSTTTARKSAAASSSACWPSSPSRMARRWTSR